MLLRLAALWHPKARQWVAGRRNWARCLDEAAKSLHGHRVVWFHCASLGEFEQGRRVMERFMELHSDWRLVLSFFSPSGYEIRKGYGLASVVCYLPLDTQSNAERFLDLVHPQIAIFVKYEFWLNVLSGLARRRIPTFLISAIFRKDQAFFGLLGRWYRRCLGLFSILFVQTDSSVNLLSTYGIRHAMRAGDTRFDRVHDAVRGMETPAWLAAFAGEECLFVMGSTWPKDEEIALLVAQQLPAGWKLVLVPHEISAMRIAQWRNRLGQRSSCYSQGVDLCARILVVDVVGMLLSIYSRADMAYVGGGFGVGIHNTLEPAAYGIPVVFGPNHGAFHEALSLLRVGGASAIDSVEDGAMVCLELMEGKQLRDTMGRCAKDYVESQIGATDFILREIGRQYNQLDHAI